MKNKIMKILETEAIRFVDGRYSKGFVDEDVLKQLVEDGLVVLRPCGRFMFVFEKDESE